VSWNAWYCLTPELKSGPITVEFVGQEVKQVLVSQLDVGDSASARARSLTGAIADGQLTEVDLEDRLGHLGDDGGGCRVLAFDVGWFWEAETINGPEGRINMAHTGLLRRLSAPRLSTERNFL